MNCFRLSIEHPAIFLFSAQRSNRLDELKLLSQFFRASGRTLTIDKGQARPTCFSPWVESLGDCPNQQWGPAFKGRKRRKDRMGHHSRTPSLHWQPLRKDPFESPSLHPGPKSWPGNVGDVPDSAFSPQSPRQD